MNSELQPPCRTRVRRVFQALVGRRTGVIQQVQPCHVAPDDAPLRYVAATTARAIAEDASCHFSVGGVGTSWEQATMAALCEGLERYAAVCQANDSLLWSSPAELGEPHVRPEELTAYSEEQQSSPGFPFTSLDENQTIAWTRCSAVPSRRVPQSTRVLLPAFAVWLAYRRHASGPLVGPGVSTGLATAESTKAAIDAAIREVVERDALALSWLGRIPVPQIPAAQVQEVGAFCLPPQAEVWAFDLTTDLSLPVAMVVTRSRGIVSVGSACHESPRQALAKAILEAAQSRVYVRQLLNSTPAWKVGQDFSNVNSFARHAEFYTRHPEYFELAFSHLLHSPCESCSHDWLSDSTPTTDADAGCYVSERGHQAYWYDLTPVPARKLALSVVRVVIPSLMPLHGDHRLASLGHARLAALETVFPWVQGRAPARNPFPHPFA